MKCDFLVERQDFRRSDLYRRKYRWGSGPGRVPKDDSEGAGAEWILYEYWGLDEDGLLAAVIVWESTYDSGDSRIGYVAVTNIATAY